MPGIIKGVLNRRKILGTEVHQCRLARRRGMSTIEVVKPTEDKESRDDHQYGTLHAIHRAKRLAVAFATTCGKKRDANTKKADIHKSAEATLPDRRLHRLFRCA